MIALEMSLWLWVGLEIGSCRSPIHLLRRGLHFLCQFWNSLQAFKDKCIYYSAGKIHILSLTNLILGMLCKFARNWNPSFTRLLLVHKDKTIVMICIFESRIQKFLWNTAGDTERGKRKKESFHLWAVLEQAEKHEMK